MSEIPNTDNRYSADHIEVLTGLEAIRRRPQMYVGSIDAPELPSHLLLEAICHAVDEIIDGTCTSIAISVTGARSARVKYDAGMSLEPMGSTGDIPAAEAFLALHMACHNLKKHIAVGHKHCQLGLAVLNALSEELVAKTCCSGKTAIMRFVRGRMAPYRIIQTDCADNTNIEFKFDQTLISGVLDRALIATEVAALAKVYPRAHFSLT